MIPDMNRTTALQQAFQEARAFQSRRWFFKECGVGLGLAALHSLMGDKASAAPLGGIPWPQKNRLFERGPSG